jgi:hypothetical protein
VYGTAKNVEITELIADAEMMVEKFNDEKVAVGDSISILSGIVNSLEYFTELINSDIL